MKLNQRAFFIVGFLTLGGLAWAAVVPAPAPGKRVAFNRDVRPLLSENCFACHGPDPGTRKAGLRLDQEQGLFGERKGGRAIVKRDPKQSLLYQRITTTDEDDVMPPPKTHKVLKPEQKEFVRRWIEQGAPWEAHWSFIAPTRPTPPAVRDAAWVRNPIDAFVLAKLDEAGLKPAPEADRRALIRRLSFDMVGLPPTPAEVEAFVNDRSPDAYEKVVDRMFASPHYGEHRARYWLDAARYADTHGLHFDNERSMWPYREWVINAFNANMPFDQFTVEQLAGDLLPDRTVPQQVASGFNRCNVTTNEGGTILEENLVFYTRDRTETTARVWLGLTANCAVCHDHKFDPITQRDFYSMSAFFNNSTMSAMDGNIKDTPPVLIVPKPDDLPKAAKLAADLAAARKAVDDRKAAARPEYDKWLAAADPAAIRASIPTAGLRLHAPLADGDGARTWVAIDGAVREVPLAPNVKWDTGQTAAKAPTSPDGPVADVPDAGNFDRADAFTAAAWIKIRPGSNGAIASRMDVKDSFRGWDLWLDNNRVGTHIISKWQTDALKVLADKPVEPNKWHHVAITYDGSGKAAGVKVYVDGEPQKTHTDVDALRGTLKTAAPFRIGQRSGADPVKGIRVQDVRLYGRALAAADMKSLAQSSRLVALLAKPADKRVEAEQKELFDGWLATSDAPSRELSAKLAALEAEDAAIKARGAATLVMQEKPEPPGAFVLFRGEYDKRRDPVPPATPSALPPFPEGAPKNRLGFAKWLLRPENPLTARVTVNRFWQEIFGTGLVKTSEDFGIMGENPSHPELLDWLAVEFRENNWDVRRLVKLIVTSATYRQAAVMTPEKLEKDPANRLLSRGPRFRLDGELVRDNALAASGLLVPKIGGPSVKPYQPPGVWEAVAMIGSNTRDYKADTGENLYRRSLYTFWKRSAPPASMDILNAPSRETCTVRRERTNTPLQALVTMNDPQFVEAARALAQAAIKDGGNTFDTRIDYMARRLVARSLRPEETAVAKAALDDLLTYYKAHADDAKKLLEVGESKRDATIDAPEHAAWTMLANQLMNLDEVLNK